MKKLTLVSLLVLFNLCVFAQEPKQQVYCQLVGTSKLLSNKVTVEVDYGQHTKFLADNRMKDPNTGRQVVFNSMVDALNFMGNQGWEFVQAYTVASSSQMLYYYVLKKPFSSLDEESKKLYYK